MIDLLDGVKIPVIRYCLTKIFSVFWSTKQPIMKPTINLLLFIVPFLVYSNTEKITIDLGKNVIITKHYVTEKSVELELIAKSGTTITVAIEKNYLAFGSFEIPQAANNAGTQEDTYKTNNTVSKTLAFGNNTIYTLDVRIFDKDGKAEGTYTIELISKSKWYWTSTFGVSMVTLVNRDTYKSLLNSDGASPATYTIVQDGSNSHYDAIPVLMFTYSKLENDFSYGVTGGLGTDFETISAFAGLSLVIGQNFIVTSGLAFHKQLRLDSQYSEGQIVDSNLTFNDLNIEYYRFNPFISLTYRLNNNPYK
jgi:hypothetical protein